MERAICNDCGLKENDLYQMERTLMKFNRNSMARN